MSADIVNLNKFRKAKARMANEHRAQNNRAKFGRTKEKKQSDADDAARRNALLDGARLSTGGDRPDDKEQP